MTEKQQTEIGISGSGAGDAARGAAGQAKEAVRETVDQAKEAVRDTAGQAKEQVAGRLSDQKARAAQSLTGVAQALRTTGEQLREQDQTGITGYVDQIASSVERLSSYVEQHEIGDLVGDVERFARRQPVLFLGGAFVLGLLGARFLKSSSSQRYQPSDYPLARRADQFGAYTGGLGQQGPRVGSTGMYDAPYSDPPYGMGLGGDVREGAASYDRPSRSEFGDDEERL